MTVIKDGVNATYKQVWRMSKDMDELVDPFKTMPQLPWYYSEDQT